MRDFVQGMLFGACLVGAISVSWAAVFSNGNDMFDRLNSDNPTNAAMARSYIAGAADMLGAVSEIPAETLEAHRTCIPEGADIQQVTDIIRLELVQAPQTRHAPSAWIILSALSETFPCKP